MSVAVRFEYFLANGENLSDIFGNKRSNVLTFIQKTKCSCIKSTSTKAFARPVGFTSQLFRTIDLGI
jgi:hypothetical protein